MVAGNDNDWMFSSVVSVWSSNSAVSKTPLKDMTVMATISCPNCSARCCCITWVIRWPLHLRIDGVFVNSQLLPVLLSLLLWSWQRWTNLNFYFLWWSLVWSCLDKYRWCDLIRILLWEGCKLTGPGRMSAARWLKWSSKLPNQSRYLWSILLKFKSNISSFHCILIQNLNQ